MKYKMYKGYKVYDNGTVIGKRGREIGAFDKDGYKKVTIRLGKGERENWNANRLIWKVFKGPIPEGFDVDHRNYNRSDNRLENLRLLPIPKNRSNKQDNKITEKDVVEIRKLLKEGNLNQTEIGKMFGVGKAIISNIKLGKRWGHLK